jgi:hypothetical protein
MSLTKFVIQRAVSGFVTPQTRTLRRNVATQQSKKTERIEKIK